MCFVGLRSVFVNAVRHIRMYTLYFETKPLALSMVLTFLGKCGISPKMTWFSGCRLVTHLMKTIQLYHIISYDIQLMFHHPVCGAEVYLPDCLHDAGKSARSSLMIFMGFFQGFHYLKRSKTQPSGHWKKHQRKQCIFHGTSGFFCRTTPSMKPWWTRILSPMACPPMSCWRNSKSR
jgi:hypothetical protein